MPEEVKTAQQSWPAWLWLVRHGESAGNVARDRAESEGAGIIDIADRDADVPLSPLGQRQSHALARWFAALPLDDRPDVVLTSPYVRAQQTAAIVINDAALSAPDRSQAGQAQPVPLQVQIDERLREKELGILDRLTRTGSMQRYPEQAELRARLGKFYHRPPGGESWCDVILRLRSVFDEIQLQHGGQRVLIVAHQVIVLCFRYLLERMTEQQILAIDAAGDVANCAVTSYRLASASTRVAPGLTLCLYNHVAPLEEVHNTAGNGGLGTSGSGDTLSGIIAGLCARGADPVQAAIWGVFLHAKAGDALATRVSGVSGGGAGGGGGLGFFARELLYELPRLMSRLGRRQRS